MDNITSYTFEESEVRTIVINDETWFIAKDVAGILGYTTTEKMTRRLDDEDKQKVKNTISGHLTSRYGNNDLIIISEPGVYSAVFGSQRPEAKSFKRWVTSVVIPSIRRTGQYSAVSAALPQTYGQLVIEYGKALVEAEQKQQVIDLQRPIVQSYDSLMSAKGNLSMADAAKIISETVNYAIGRNILMRILRSMGIMDKNNIPYQRLMNMGYFNVVVSNPNDSGVKKTTLLTAKGMDFVRESILSLSERDLAHASGSAAVVKAMARHKREKGSSLVPACTRLAPIEIEVQSEISLDG
jgi:anti-repressor protein